MKVEGTGPIRTQSVKRPRRADGTSATDFADMLSGGTEDSAPVGGPASVAVANPLFALQEADDATVRRERARKRGKDLLDQLDELRVALLTGSLPKGQVQALAALVKSQRDEVDDPGLRQVLDEIDLRAQVELAKLDASV